MILLILGTQDKPFTRILKEIDREIKLGNIKEKVIAQIGNTKYKSKNMQIFNFVSNDDFQLLIDKADLIITHGGVGTILEALRKKKKIIAIARLKKYGEHVNDHQKQIIREFKNMGYLLELEKETDLKEIIENSQNFVPKKYVSNTKKFTDLMEKYIDNL